MHEDCSQPQAGDSVGRKWVITGCLCVCVFRVALCLLISVGRENSDSTYSFFAGAAFLCLSLPLPPALIAVYHAVAACHEPNGIDW